MSSKLPEKVEIQLVSRCGTVLLENDTEVIVTKDSKIHDLLFKDTFTLEADTKYFLRFNFPEVEETFFHDSLVPQVHKNVLFDDSLSFEMYSTLIYNSILYMAKAWEKSASGYSSET